MKTSFDVNWVVSFIMLAKFEQKYCIFLANKICSSFFFKLFFFTIFLFEAVNISFLLS